MAFSMKRLGGIFFSFYDFEGAKMDSAPFKHDISVKIPVSSLVPKPFRWLRLGIKIVLEVLVYIQQ